MVLKDKIVTLRDAGLRLYRNSFLALVGLLYLKNILKNKNSYGHFFRHSGTTYKSNYLEGRGRWIA
jgi:hypothetical protein